MTGGISYFIPLASTSFCAAAITLRQIYDVPLKFGNSNGGSTMTDETFVKREEIVWGKRTSTRFWRESPPLLSPLLLRSIAALE